MAICSHMTDRQPTVTSETRSAGLSYPIMSGMPTVTGLGLFLLSVASAKSPAYRDPSSLFLFSPLTRPLRSLRSATPPSA